MTLILKVEILWGKSEKVLYIYQSKDKLLCYDYKIGNWFWFQKLPVWIVAGEKQSLISVYVPQYMCSASIATQLLTRKAAIDDLACFCIVVKLQLYKVRTVIWDSHQGELK